MAAFEWEPWLAPYIPLGGRTALDIGANEGQWAQMLSHRFATVLAVEPSPHSAEILRSLNLPNVTVLECAAWLHGCDLPFALRHGESTKTDIECVSGHSAVACRDFHRGQFPAESITVRGEAMDDLRLENVDFIKIDVEGGELLAIQGCTQIIERDHPTIVVECHAQENADWIMTWLTRCGYNLHHIHGPGYRPGDSNWLTHTWIAAEWPQHLH